MSLPANGEKERYLTGEALEIMAEFTFPVHIMTKSDLVLRDLDVIAQISRIYAAVTFTITTIDDDLGKKVEPGSPRVSARFEAMEALSAAGISVRLIVVRSTSCHGWV
jgi:DNA repair photolyase